MSTIELETRIRDFVNKQGFFQINKKILLAVSGGIDSMCMLEIFRSLLIPEGMVESVGIAHVEHGLRGDESKGDLAFVQEIARVSGIEFHAISIDVNEEKLQGESMQQAARRLRYDFLFNLADERGYEAVATAHNIDDSIETFLMNLFRGAGCSGLKGIPPCSEKLIRPVLCLSRKDIGLYCESKGVGFREDSSNKTPAYRRNDVRLNLIPVLREHCAHLETSMDRTFQILNEEDSFMREFADGWLRDFCVSPSGSLAVIRMEGLAILHKAIRRRVVRSMVEAVCSVLEGVTLEEIDKVLELVEASAQGKVYRLGPSAEASCSCGYLEVYAEPVAGWEFAIPDTGSIELPSSLGEISISQRKPGPYPSSRMIADLDMDSIAGSLKVMSDRKETCFVPFGRNSEVRVDEFLRKQGMPSELRKRLPVVCDDNGPVWVCGIRMAERIRITSTTKDVIRLEFENPSLEKLLSNA